MIIMGITNRSICINFYEQINKLAKSKLNYLIIREKDLSNVQLLELALKVKEKLKNTNIKIIINSNIDVAKQIDADGVQLSFKDFIELSNKFNTKNAENFKETQDSFYDKDDKSKIYKMVGVSIHSFEEGVQAYNLGADYVIYGHVFETDCKKGLSPRGVKEIEELSKNINIPIIGLGGIDRNNFRKVIDSGASGIAIMSSLMKSDNPKDLLATML